MLDFKLQEFTLIQDSKQLATQWGVVIVTLRGSELRNEHRKRMEVKMVDAARENSEEADLLMRSKRRNKEDEANKPEMMGRRGDSVPTRIRSSEKRRVKVFR